VDLPLEPVHQVGAGHGTDRVGGISGIADLQVGDGALHDEALGGKATLTAVDEA
jgi:hypothetical protein